MGKSTEILNVIAVLLGLTFGVHAAAQDLEGVVVSAQRETAESFCKSEPDPLLRQNCMVCYDNVVLQLQRKVAIDSSDEAIWNCARQRKAEQVGQIQGNQNTAAVAGAASAAGTDPADMFTDDVYQVEIENFKAACKVEEQKASECCMHPDRCMGSVDGKTETENGAMGQFVTMLMGTAAQIPSSDITQMCSRMGDLGKASAAINTYLASRCTMAVRQCKATCSEAQSNFLANYSWGETHCESALERRQNEGCALFWKVKNSYVVAEDTCGKMENQAVRLGNQAVSSAMSSKYADMCKQQASKKTDPFNGKDPFAMDCTGAQATTPFCQFGCNRPEMAATPSCQQIVRDQGGGPGLGPSGPGGSNISELFNGVPSDPEAMQDPIFNETQAKNAGLSKGTAEPGGGLPGGGDPGNGGDPGYGGVGADPAGYNTDIFNGQRSGGGYAGPGGGYKPGGASGYSAPSGNGSSILGSLFNLNKFLPGGKKTGGLATGRGIASVRGDVSPSHANIFKKISDRYYAVCMRDALQDCSSLKKIRGGR